MRNILLLCPFQVLDFIFFSCINESSDSPAPAELPFVSSARSSLHPGLTPATDILCHLDYPLYLHVWPQDKWWINQRRGFQSPRTIGDINIYAIWMLWVCYVCVGGDIWLGANGGCAGNERSSPSPNNHQW